MQQKLELPHTQNGDVDWKTLGNILSACLLGEVLCASYVDYKYGKRTRDFQADTDWEFSYEEKNVIVLCKRFRDSPLNVFMGRTVIDAPVNEVVQYMAIHERRKEWDKYLVEIKEVRRISPTDCILYMLLEAKRCLVRQQREFLFYERMTYIGNKYVRSAISVDLPEVPQKPKIPRADLRPGSGFVLEPYPDDDSSKTLISFIAHVDLKNLPPLIINRAMRRQPMSVYRIRRIINSGQAQLPISIQDDLESMNTFTASDQYAVAVYSGTTQPADGRSEFTASMNHPFFEDSIPIGDFLSNTKPDAVHRSHSVPATMCKVNSKVSDEFQFENGHKHLQTLEDEEELQRERRDSTPLFSDDYRKTPDGLTFRLRDTGNASGNGVEVHGSVKGGLGEDSHGSVEGGLGEDSFEKDDHFDKTPRQNEFLLHLEHPTIFNGSPHDSDKFVDAQDDIPLLNGLTIASETDEEFGDQSQLQNDFILHSSTLPADDDGMTATEVEPDVPSSQYFKDSSTVTNSTDQKRIAQELEKGTALRQSVSPFSSDDDECCNSLPTLTLASAVKSASPDEGRPQKVQSANDILANSSQRYQESSKNLTSPINGSCDTANGGGLQIDIEEGNGKLNHQN